MKAGVNKVIIKVKGRYKKESGIIGVNGQEIVIDVDGTMVSDMTKNLNVVDAYQEYLRKYEGAKVETTEFRPELHTTISGEVVSVPEKLGSHELCREYDGFPVYRSKNEPNVIKYSEMPIEVLPRDRVYFHFHSLSNDTFMYKEAGYEFYQIEYDQIFCYVRDGKICPISNYVLVEPYYGVVDEIEVDGKKIRGRQTDSGLVSEIAETPRYLEGVAKHIPAFKAGFEFINVKAEDRVYFTTDSEFENEIEGTVYYVMKLQDIFAINNTDCQPVGAWVMISEEKEEITASGLAVVGKQYPNKGKIVKKGPSVQKVESEDKVIFQPRTPNRVEIEGFLFIKEQDIFCTVK